VHILRQNLTVVQSTYAYLFNALASRYTVFLASLKTFWDSVLQIVEPSNKIKVMELKHVLFEGIACLKTRYFD
jgi:hypothetical protein